MNLMKWLRKNNKKLMAVVVIVLMVAFVGGSSFHYLFQGSGGAKKAVAYYGHQHKITHLDRMAASQEIEMLTALGVEGLLQAQDLRGLFLGELVFRESRHSGMFDMARRAIRQNRYRISDRQLSEILTHRNVPPDIFWILLCEEARTAGIRLSTEDVGQVLERLIPPLFEQRTYGQMIPLLMSRFGVPEETILTTFGKLLSVLQYAQVISSIESVTASQIKHLASRESESLDVEFVQLEANSFADKKQMPPEQAVREQFNRYKDSFPGQVSEANPFGFGYRLPDRIQLDYIALKLSDVATIIKPPTGEETEQYYQQNRDRQFTEQVPANPNDPNSPQVTRVRSYAEVVDTIVNQLRQQRITTKAEQILQEARSVADANLPSVGPDGEEPTTAQREEKVKDDDYAQVAEKVGKRHHVTLYSGRTGLLSVMNMQGDKVLRRMFLTAYGQNPVPLNDVLFSVKELGDSATILLTLPPAEMYVSVGPAKDPMSATASNLTDQVMVIARVVAAQKNAPPADLDVRYSTRTIGLGETADPKDEVFSVEEQVVKDVQALEVWDAARSRAEEFLALAGKDGWDRAVAQFNERYGAAAKEKPDDPNVFEMNQQMGLQRISRADLAVLAAQVANTPAAPIILNQAQQASHFVDQLYSLIPAGSDKPAQLPTIVESKPNQSFYVLKDLSLQRLTQEDFQRMKGSLVRREEYTQIESLAAVHFHPENILKRMNFRFAHPVDEPGEGQDETRQESKEAS
jgi:hypothetical protein